MGGVESVQASVKEKKVTWTRSPWCFCSEFKLEVLKNGKLVSTENIINDAIFEHQHTFEPSAEYKFKVKCTCPYGVLVASDCVYTAPSKITDLNLQFGESSLTLSIYYRCGVDCPDNERNYSGVSNAKAEIKNKKAIVVTWECPLESQFAVKVKGNGVEVHNSTTDEETFEYPCSPSMNEFLTGVGGEKNPANSNAVFTDKRSVTGDGDKIEMNANLISINSIINELILSGITNTKRTM